MTAAVTACARCARLEVLIICESRDIQKDAHLLHRARDKAKVLAHIKARKEVIASQQALIDAHDTEHTEGAS